MLKCNLTMYLTLVRRLNLCYIFLVVKFLYIHFSSPVKRISGQLHVCQWSLESPAIPKNEGILHRLTANVATKLLMSDHLLQDQNRGFHLEAVCGTSYMKSKAKEISLSIQ